MATRKTLPTWSARKKFQYKGSVRKGTTIYCGTDFRYAYTMSADQYAGMLAKFSGQEVNVGTSRTDPPNGSLGKWLTDKYGQYGMTSYVGPILIHEGFAIHGSASYRILVK